MKPKPSPSIIASFIIFICTGIYTMIILNDSFFSKLPLLIKISLFLAILFNAVYYYITEYETENDMDFQINLEKVHKSEWYIRIFNQTVLFSLWFLLQQSSLTLFAIGLFLLFLSYLIWDFIAYPCFKNNKLFIIDLVGFISTILFIFIGYVQFYAKVKPGDLDKERNFEWIYIWGGIVFVYIMIPIAGFLIKHPSKRIISFINKN